MTERTNENGFPYSNDPIKVGAIAGVIAEQIIASVEPGRLEPTPLDQTIESHAEYPGMTNGEYWLAVMKAASALHDHAFEKFTNLVTDKDEDWDSSLNALMQKS